MADDDHIARLYLLGELPAGERDRFEDRYLADPELFARVERAEAELLDDWAAGRLSPARAAGLESRYGAGLEGRRRLGFARALSARAGAAAAAGPAAGGRPSASRSARRPLRAALWAAAVLAAAALAVPAWRAWFAPAPPAESPAGTEVATLSLRPGLTRGGGSGAATVALPPGASVLELRLDAPAAVAYRATLESAEGRPLWRGEGAAASAGGAAAELVLRLPARDLPPGDYVLALDPAAGAPAAAAAEYFFRVAAGP